VFEVPGCDWWLERSGDQFRGGTLGQNCLDLRSGARRYVDLQLVIGSDLYWYRRRVLMRRNDALQEEAFGYDWFELNEARLFSCRVEWSPPEQGAERRPLAHLDLHDQGGRARFSTPDGRSFELALHSQDWPYMADRDALILQLTDLSSAGPVASAWTDIDAEQVSIDLPWLHVRCGSIVPETEELSGGNLSVPRAPHESVDILQQNGIEPLGCLHHEEMPGVRDDVELEVRQRLADPRGIGGCQV
jgi:hypothetical protein